MKEALKEEREKWDRVKLKGEELRENELMDYHPTEVNKDNENYRNKKRKILRGIKKAKQRNHTFRYLTRHAGKKKR